MTERESLISFRRWNPGWTLHVGPIWLHWHVLNAWKWGKDPHFACITRNHAHVGKRLVTWSICERWWLRGR